MSMLDDIVPWSWHGPEGDPDRIALLDREDVRETLRNPTDEQVNMAVRATGMSRWDLRRAWAAAAGDER